jgi:hypothetical protein
LSIDPTQKKKLCGKAPQVSMIGTAKTSWRSESRLKFPPLRFSN